MADFIGFSNLIEGKIASVDEEAGLAFVDTPIGRLACDNMLGYKEGENVLIAIRPENITFNKDGLKCQIVKSAFIGEAMLYWLKVSDITLCAKVHSSLDLSCGSEVHIQLQPNHCKIVKI